MKSKPLLVLGLMSGTSADEMTKEYELHNKRYARYFTYFYEAIFRDKYYVMGDYDPDSSDSRYWGPVQAGSVVGEAWFIYFPFKDFGPLP